jgi:hypothetical protein
VINISSYNVFGIYVDKTQTTPRSVNHDKLKEVIDDLISDKIIHKVVIVKRWV